MLAPNPGPMTLEGTNTWIVGDVGKGPPVVVDPGPADEGHLQAVLACSGGRIAEIVLTHRHGDHAAGAPRLAELAGCRVLAADPACCLGSPVLRAGDEIAVAGARLTAYPTPGHTSDSFSLLLRAGSVWLLTGDTVLGRGPTVIAQPDGHLQSYFDSLTRLEELVAAMPVREILPGHGPRVTSPGPWLASCRAHREARLEQVRGALAAGDQSAGEIAARIYTDVDPALRPAAEQSVLAQLEYLTST